MYEDDAYKVTSQVCSNVRQRPGPYEIVQQELSSITTGK